MSQSHVIDRISSLRAELDTVRRRGSRVGFVPTMGALHEGHFSLIREATRHADYVVASVFVNPAQFGPNEDYARYPRTLEADVHGCTSAGAAAVFAPSVAELYPEGEQTRVHVGALAEPLCGAFRPGHFEGVATVVAKFFGLFAPCVAVFGKKDFQQLRVIERMARDLCFAVEIVGHPIVRERGGLAMSSRNAYLSPGERARALSIPRSLAAAVGAFGAGERQVGALLGRVRAEIAPAVDSVDYVSVAFPATLRPLGEEESVESTAVLALAVRIGATRLIDNVVLGEDPAPDIG